ncbi:hypothetical protein [Bradyrhizobium sp. RT6a]|uniref:hypothetical protein n=1 Tax=unclassified Bradyrhizobium TaxID=2631580 RepID=UPI003395FEEF
MTKTDQDDWHTGEFEQIKPIAPSFRGKPRPTTARSEKTNDSVATDQGQNDEQPE